MVFEAVVVTEACNIEEIVALLAVVVVVSYAAVVVVVSYAAVVVVVS